MAKKLTTKYQVCPNEGTGWNTLHEKLEDAVHEARMFLPHIGPKDVLHICEIREVRQVKRKS